MGYLISVSRVEAECAVGRGVAEMRLVTPEAVVDNFSEDGDFLGEHVEPPVYALELGDVAMTATGLYGPFESHCSYGGGLGQMLMHELDQRDIEWKLVD